MNQIGYIMFWIGFIAILIATYLWKRYDREEAWENELDQEYEDYIYWHEYFNEEVKD